MGKAAVASLGIGGVIGALYIGACGWMGLRIESAHAEQVARLQARLPFLQIVGQSYERGFFTSRSAIALRIGCEQAEGAPDNRMFLKNVIHHGPLPGGFTLGLAEIESELVLPPEVQAQVDTLLKGQAPLSMHTVVGYTGGFTTRLNSPAVDIPGREGQTLSWKGASATLRGDAQGRQLDYDVSIPGIGIADQQAGVSVQAGAITLKVEGVSATESGSLKAGKTLGNLASLRLRAAGGKAAPSFEATLSDFSLQADTSVNGELLAGSTRLRGRGAIGTATLEGFDATIAVRRIHAPTYERLLANLLQSQASCYVNSRRPNAAAAWAQAQADLAGLLRFNPEVAIDPLQIAVGGQQGEASLSFGVRGVVPEDDRLPLPVFLLTRGQIGLNARLPLGWIQALARQASARSGGMVPEPAAIDLMIDQAAARNFLVRDGDFVKTSVYYANQKLVVNGKRTSLDGR